MIDLIVKIQTFTNNQIKDRIGVLHKATLLIMSDNFVLPKRDSNPGEWCEKIKLEPFHYPVLIRTHVLFSFISFKNNNQESVAQIRILQKVIQIVFWWENHTQKYKYLNFHAEFFAVSYRNEPFFYDQPLLKIKFLNFIQEFKKKSDCFFFNLKYLIFRNFRL